MRTSTTTNPSISLEEAKKRLLLSEISLRENFSENPERIKIAFRQRATQLAKEKAEGKSISEGIPTLIFRLGQETYAIVLTELAEVVSYQGCTQVPGTSPPFLGVINLRGKILPVIDLAPVLAGSPSLDSGALLILRRQVALRVDAVQELRVIHSEELTRTIQTLCLQALASGTLGLIDVEALLAAVLGASI